MKTAIVGGGAAGFFCAIELKRRCPDMQVTIFEQQRKVLAKVEISGGGRCNCTNSFEGVTDLRQVYPRGGQLLKRLFKTFSHEDAYRWFEEHGVPLVVQDDHCVFPEAQDSHAIIDCFLSESHRLGVEIRLNNKVQSPDDLLGSYDNVVWTVGGLNSGAAQTLKDAGVGQLHPSLFTFNIKDKQLNALMGVVIEDAILSIPGTKFKIQDALLLTHWGMSGPATLKLSSHAAIYLAENAYRSPLLVNWTGETNADVVREELQDIAMSNSQKLLSSYRPFSLQQRLWDYLLLRAELSGKRWSELGKKPLNKLVDILTNDRYLIEGRAAFKDEFVTAGGISLDAVDRQTLESKHIPNLYFAGEVLDIDGITGGFNFQAAWTTAYCVAKAIAEKRE